MGPRRRGELERRGEQATTFPPSAHNHTGSGESKIPLGGIDPTALTSAGGTEANRIAVTDASGRVGRAINSDQLGGVAAASYARKDVAETFSQSITVQSNLTVAGRLNLNANAGARIVLPVGVDKYAT